MEKIEKLPIYTLDRNLIKKRKQNYINMGKEIYPKTEPLTEEKYDVIFNSFNSGNKHCLNELFTLSIDHIIKTLANIYAKYDIENVLPFEESLSVSLEAIIKYVNNYETLPNSHWDYLCKILNITIYNKLTKIYSRTKHYQDKVETQPNSSIIYIIDKQGSQSNEYSKILINEARERINKTKAKLPSRNAKVLELRYGLNNNNPLTFEEIGKIENVGRNCAHQLVSAALKRVRKPENIKKLNIYKDLDFQF